MRQDCRCASVHKIIGIEVSVVTDGVGRPDVPPVLPCGDLGQRGVRGHVEGGGQLLGGVPQSWLEVLLLETPGQTRGLAHLLVYRI